LDDQTYKGIYISHGAAFELVSVTKGNTGKQTLSMLLKVFSDKKKFYK
jgi:hypothetical protein